MSTIAQLPVTLLDAAPEPPLRTRLAEHLALQLSGAFTPEDCAAWIAGVYASRQDWVADFDAQQYTLGKAWYTHLEQGRSREYFAGAGEADAQVERFAPGLQARLRDLATRIVGAPVRPRRGWCGPGVHIFPVGAEVARLGGTVHYDLEGLTPAQVEVHAPALSLIGMLQPAEAGGGLRLWSDRHEAAGDDASCGDLPPPAATLRYAAGDLVVIDSYRLHQIEPFTGGRDRVSVTAHLAEGPGGWELWF